MIGRTIKGKYRIYDEVGSGGFATVFLGRNLETNEIVAVKVLSEQYTKEPRYVERFEREATLAARLQHPNTVRILDHGVEAGTHFLVMEFVQGLTLKQIIKRQGRVSVQETLSYLDGICAGLQAAFQVGIVHRDIKPANLMVTPDGSVKIMDFGIARAESMSGLTQSGVFLGTPRYISPEMAQGTSTDIRSDLYSVGLLAYEMLSGEPPFDADNPWAVLRQQIESDPVPLRQSHPDVPPWLEAIVFRAMAKDPGQRFQTPAEMQAALREHSPTPGWTSASTDSTLSAVTVARASAEIQDVPASERQAGKPRGLILVLLAAGILAILALVVFFIFGMDAKLPSISPAPGTDAQVAAMTRTPQPTNTPIVLIATNTPTVMGVTGAPTEAAVPVTSAPTHTVPVLEPTETPTPAPISTLSPAPTDTPALTDTSAPTDTAVPEPTATASPPPTNTPEPTVPPSPAPSHTPRPTDTPASPPTPQVTGRLAFSAGGALHIVDAATGQDTIPPISGMRQPDLRADGQLVIADGDGDRASLWTIHADSGALDREQSPFTDDYHPSWSPGGDRFAYDSLHHGKGNYQVVYTQAYTSRQPQPDQALEYGDQWIRGTSPVWMADDWIAFTGCDYWPGGSGGSSCGIYRLPSWGGAPALIYPGSLTLRATDNYGSRLLFMSQETGNWEVYLIPAQGGTPLNLSNSPGSQDGLGTFSPDGKMVAFVSNRGGGWGVWAAQTDGTGLTKLFSLPAAPTSPWNEEKMSWGP